jgi:guanylate kinase
LAPTKDKIYLRNFLKERRNRPGKLVVISGPSGVGKGTLVGEALKRVPALYVSVSATTRRPRPVEREGLHYYFLSETEFKRRIAQGAFLEYANVYGDLYGTPVEPIKQALEQGKTVILEIDVQGAKQVKEKLGEEAVYVFIAPPSLEELQKRLKRRKTESAAAQERRLDIAVRELELADDYDFVIINDDLEIAVDELAHILKK